MVESKKPDILTEAQCTRTREAHDAAMLAAGTCGLSWDHADRLIGGQGAAAWIDGHIAWLQASVDADF